MVQLAAPAAAPAAPSQSPLHTPPDATQQAAIAAAAAALATGTPELGTTAFRVAEKHYQLHRDQDIKVRKGKRRGGKFTIRPTDFSAVINLHGGTVNYPGVRRIWVPVECLPGSSSSSSKHEAHGFKRPEAKHEQQQQQQQQAGQQPRQHLQHQQQQASTSEQHTPSAHLKPAFLFDRHPGLIFFPAALAASQQLRLVEAALLTWPDPPAHSNHNAAYPLGFPGLFAAAKAGLRSVVKPSPLAGAAAGGGMYGAAAGAAAGAEAERLLVVNGDGTGSGGQEQQPGEQHQQQQHEEVGGGKQHVSGCKFRDHENGTATSSSTACSTANGSATTANSSSSSSDGGGSVPQSPAFVPLHPSEVWSSEGEGPLASDMLRRLRWVTLGPTFNWTARVYEPWVPHTPLPDELMDIALKFEAAAAAAEEAAAAVVEAEAATDGGTAAAASSVRAASAAAVEAATATDGAAARVVHVAGEVGAGPVIDSCCCYAAEKDAGGRVAASLAWTQGAATARRYVPDAALVNYYKVGDTLGGHIDDAENDMAQPIVTLSLGCDAVFLIGGETRDVAPSALLLRSGDVLVMSGQARRSFHGVPRVLEENLLWDAWEGMAGEVRGGGVEGGELKQVCLEYARGCRINVSVRCIS